MLRLIRPGDVFCFTRNDGPYYFGQIISESSMGHFAQIFDIRRREPSLTHVELQKAIPVMKPVVLDSYSLFDMKSDQDGDWRIIGRYEPVNATDLEHYFFVYGVPGNWSKVNATNSVRCAATEVEAMVLPPHSPLNNFKVWREIDSLSHRWAE
ncbi:Imm26 family immunity protein [Stenotrophomonas maltophilia]|uniref:Imm26 family immunity protein n=1 Tax=Stenotrophomonas maltophilia TaxID=40324 RepID=UPI00083F866F|nr:Imm26 family immunity protein [Stenotrophomonas maltophilia]MBY6280504.1 phosphotriesterase [Stenotrophomonas maltophilia]